MIPTTQWMSKAFRKYNATYFGGQLPTPKFAIMPLKNEWGRYELDAEFDSRRRIHSIKNGNGELILTNAYSRSEHSIIGTLLHEMIHEYVFLVMGIYPRNLHGTEFREMANMINSDGWNISEINDMTDTDRMADENDNEIGENVAPSIFCIYEPNPQYNIPLWGLKVEKDDIRRVITRIKETGGSNPRFYYCYSYALDNVRGNPTTLNGFGGNTEEEIAARFGRYYHEDEDIFSTETMRRIR